MEALQIAASSLLLKQASISVHGGYTLGDVAQTADEAGDVIRDGGMRSPARYYGDRMMIGYLNDPERTAKVMQNRLGLHRRRRHLGAGRTAAHGWARR